jgi:hypothetical protein
MPVSDATSVTQDSPRCRPSLNPLQSILVAAQTDAAYQEAPDVLPDPPRRGQLLYFMR